MNSYEDPAAWEPPPARHRGLLVVRFVASLLYWPVHMVWCLVLLGVLTAVGAVVDLVGSVSTRAEKAVERRGDRLADLMLLPSWYVGLREVRHEGDAGYYRARVDRAVARHTEQVTQQRPLVSREWSISRRDYRGAGARYVAERALAQGWQLRPSDVRKKVILHWPPQR
ncbi:hypothetical protein [Streptomyces sp. NPDC127190]|uniref:hypothetical protein n=1 Tax=unclassified Streptomyces TaxID=2593676 RepID=UPI003634AF7B